MVLSFRPQFVPKILDGTKIHTIRENAGNRWKKGNLINMATGVRTPYYNEFSKRVCCGTQKLFIKWNTHFDFNTGEKIKDFEIYIDNKQLSRAGRIELMNNDGFDSYTDFINFFPENFTGTIIHWTNKMY